MEMATTKDETRASEVTDTMITTIEITTTTTMAAMIRTEDTTRTKRKFLCRRRLVLQILGATLRKHASSSCSVAGSTLVVVVLQCLRATRVIESSSSSEFM